MRAEIQERHPNKCIGFYFEGAQAYMVEVDRGIQFESSEYEISVESPKDEELYEASVVNQPVLTGVGDNKQLALNSYDPSLPSTDEELEAFARYALEHGAEENLVYEGEKDILE